MNKRSIPLLILLDICTLGLYELYWFFKTRNEMVNKYSLKIPSVFWLIAVKALQIGSILCALFIVLYAIPANNKRTDTLVRPPAECYIQYSQSQEATQTSKEQSVGNDCKNQINNYYQTDNTVQLLLILLGLYTTSLIALFVVLKRWFVPYAEAVATVTKQQLTSTNAMILLAVVPSPFGMIAIQKMYNKDKY